MLSVLDEPSAPSGLQTLPYISLWVKLLILPYIFLLVQLLRLGPEESNANGLLKQSQLSLTSLYDQLQEAPFLISTLYQRFCLHLRDGEILLRCLSIVTTPMTGWLSTSLGSHTSTNVHICYWAWKSLRTLHQPCVHVTSVHSLSGSDIPFNFIKAKISSAVILYWKISQSIVLVIHKKSVELLFMTCVLLLHLFPTVQRCLQRLPLSLTHCITTTWKTRQKVQVQFRTVCIIIFLVLLCTQLCLMVLRHSRAKHTTSNRTAVVLIVMCSLHLSLAHPTQRERNLATHLNSVIQRHTRENSITSRTLTLRLTGGPNVGYCVTVAMGSVPQELCMLVDTGSANFAVAGSSQAGIDEWLHTASSSTYMEVGTSITVRYTTGEWSGTLSKDLVSLGNTAPFEASFAVIDSSENFFIEQATWVGILGLGYSSLVKPDSSIPTVWDTFRSQTGMQDLFSLQLCPPLDILVTGGTSLQGGWMVLGGVNHSMYEGDIFNTSIVKEKFYNVIVTNLTVGNTRINMDCTEFNNDKAIIDSGTTDIFLPDPVYEEVKAAFKTYFADGMPLEVPDTFWNGTSKLMWQAQHKDEIFSSFPTFHIGFSSNEDSSEGFSLAVTPQTYLRQISGTGAEISTTNITCYPCDFFTFGIKSRPQGTVIGSNMMLGFYTIFDREKRKIGFARSKCSYHSESSAKPYIEGPYPRDPVDCRYTPPQDIWELSSYICAGIALPMGAITLAVALFFRCRSCLGHKCCKCCKCKCNRYKALRNTVENNNIQNDNDVSLEATTEQPESNTSEGASVTTKITSTAMIGDTVIPRVDEGVCVEEEEEDDNMESRELITGREHNGDSPTDEGYNSLNKHMLHKTKK